MHQPEDEEDGGEATNGSNKDSRRGKRVNKASEEKVKTFGGMKKGFLLPGAKKTSLQKQKKKYEVDEVIGKTFSSMMIEDEDDLGDIEFQMLGDGDVEEQSSTAWDECTKYPGHVGFIPLSTFSLQNLPKRFQRQDVFDIIEVYADLTVRLRVKSSPDRPKDGQFAKGSGFTGTGWISYVELIEKDCICKDCKRRGDKDRMWWSITINSATHCVYDVFEANNSKVDFFYDTQQSLRKGEMKTVSGVRMLSADRTDDVCFMECATHDVDLGRYLQLRLDHLMQLEGRMLSSPNSPFPISHKTLMCISHPHGKPKHVTVGELKHECDITYKDPSKALTVSRDRTESGLYQQLYLYETRVCPGSSGARLFCLDDFLSGDRNKIYSRDCTHRGVHLATGLNKGLARRFESVQRLNDYFERRGIRSKKDFRDHHVKELSLAPAWED